MTRREFIEEVTTFRELRDFCNDIDYDRLYDFFDGDDFDSFANDDIYDWMRDGGDWDTLRGTLNDLNPGCDFYERVSALDYVGYDIRDDMFEELKNDVLEYADENGYFDDEDEDDVCEDCNDGEQKETREEPHKIESLWWGNEEVSA